MVLCTNLNSSARFICIHRNPKCQVIRLRKNHPHMSSVTYPFGHVTVILTRRLQTTLLHWSDAFYSPSKCLAVSTSYQRHLAVSLDLKNKHIIPVYICYYPPGEIPTLVHGFCVIIKKLFTNLSVLKRSRSYNINMCIHCSDKFIFKGTYFSNGIYI